MNSIGPTKKAKRMNSFLAIIAFVAPPELVAKIVLRQQAHDGARHLGAASPPQEEEPSQRSSDDTSSAVLFGEETTQIQVAVGLTYAELGRIASRFPGIRDCGAARALDCAAQLQLRLSLSELEFKKKIVLQLPQCLGYDYESEVGPSLLALQSGRLDLSEDELRSLVLKCPQIIGMDYAAHVKPNIHAIIQDAGGDTAVAKARILNKPASLDLPVRGRASRTGAA